jgi:TolB-like protein
MGVDEDGTHQHYTAHLRELITPKIRQHRGRIVKSTGDGLLAEFTSVFAAVQCAVEVQYGVGIRNSPVKEDKRVAFRIGIHVSDVITETGHLFGDDVPGDIYGDGVNIAARLESLAEPNGICVSHAVHDQIRDKMPYGFEDLGGQPVKNMARPLHTFALRAETIAGLAITNWEPVPLPPEPAPAEVPQQRAPRLSIVVLPFTNLSGDRDQQYLADAVTDDVTTDLSRISDMVVISRNTAFTYRDRPVDTRQIGRDLNVRYLMGGSVRRAGNRLRVNTHLIDAESDAHVWAERFDHDSGDLFALQDEITSKIAVALNLELINAEAARPTERPAAFDFVLQGRAALYNYQGLTRERFVEAIALFDRALIVNPASVEARAMLALGLTDRVLEQATDSAPTDIARAAALIEEVVAMSPRHPRANFVKGQVLRAQHRHELAIPEYQAAIALDRNWVQAIAALGMCKFFTGAIEEVIPAQEHAIRLSPRDPRLPNWFWRIAMIHLLQSRTAAAILWLERARNANPWLAGPRAWLASAFALEGDMQRATAELAEAQRLSGDNRYASITSHKVAQRFDAPSIVALFEDTFFAGLRKAGVPDE